MSIETETSAGEKVSWGLFPNRFGLNDEVHIGNFEFNRTEFSIAMLQFVYGAKEIPIGSTAYIKIPEDVSGAVEIGGIKMPYAEFVEGFFWHVTNTGRFTDEHQVPLSAIQNSSALALRDKLLQEAPARDEEGLSLARRFKEGRRAPGGIHGLRTEDLVESRAT